MLKKRHLLPAEAAALIELLEAHPLHRVGDSTALEMACELRHQYEITGHYPKRKESTPPVNCIDKSTPASDDAPK